MPPLCLGFLFFILMFRLNLSCSPSVYLWGHILMSLAVWPQISPASFLWHGLQSRQYQMTRGKGFPRGTGQHPSPWASASLLGLWPLLHWMSELAALFALGSALFAVARSPEREGVQGHAG